MAASADLITNGNDDDNDDVVATASATATETTTRYGSLSLASSSLPLSTSTKTTRNGDSVGGGGGRTSQGAEHNDYDDVVIGGGRRNRVASLVFLVVSVAVVVSVIIATAASMSARRTREGRGQYRDASDGVEGNVGDGGYRSVPPIPTRPLSKLSPSELGLKVATRSERDVPGKVWGPKLLGEEGGGGGGNDDDDNDHNGDDNDNDNRGNGRKKTPLPTNSWYQNLLTQDAGIGSTEANQVYTVPYILDTVGPIPGVRMHWPLLSASPKNMQMLYDSVNGLTLGADNANGGNSNNNDDDDDDDNDDNDDNGAEIMKMATIGRQYQVDDEVDVLSPLGISLKWKAESSASGDDDDDGTQKGANFNNENEDSMTTYIVRGMPYATMKYVGRTIVPSIASGNAAAEDPLIDGTQRLTCGRIADDGSYAYDDDDEGGGNGDDGIDGRGGGGIGGMVAEKEIQVHFKNSDFTYVVFVSRPAHVECASVVENNLPPGVIEDIMFKMKMVPLDRHRRTSTKTKTDGRMDGDQTTITTMPFYVRAAMLDQCTTGRSDIRGHCDERERIGDTGQYLDLLRAGASSFPANPTLSMDYGGADERDVATVVFDWDARNVHLLSDGDVAAGTTAERRRLGSSSATATIATEVADLNESESSLLMYALPHHQSFLANGPSDGSPSSSPSLPPTDAASSSAMNGTTTATTFMTTHCVHTFHGRTCLVRGSRWELAVPLGEPQSFHASRPPDADAVPDLARAVRNDVRSLRPSNNLMRGAADTYFSGKILAKLGRVILIADELLRLAAVGEGNGGDGSDVTADSDSAEANSRKESVARKGEYDPRRRAAAAAANDNTVAALLPTRDDISNAIDVLRRAVQVWVDGTAEAEFIYDESWGGLVNCGCDYAGYGEWGSCVNSYPDCPVLEDVNLDFGNGFYMDHHFHYGYHIYAAAVVAKFDPAWGREYFDRVLLYVRDIANPSADDPFFPQFRHKDWYLGSSWASGLISAGLPTPPHGRNQESSSEAIASYEAIALYGDVMINAFDEGDCNSTRKEDAKLLRNLGRLLTSMEVHAAKSYWHVWNGTDHINAYPPEYKEAVVGMLHETMASFQTWFAPEDFVSYGIQLLPFTAVSERRDNPEWASILYPLYRESCFKEESYCVDNGWTVVLSGLRATIGERKEALEDVLSIPSNVFNSEGACGHSLSNMIWYISTRPDVGKKD